MAATSSLDLDPGLALGAEPAESPAAPRLAVVPGVSFFDRLLPGLAADAVPEDVRDEIAPVIALLDGRTVAAVVAESPFSAVLTLRILDKLVEVGGAMTAQAAAAMHARQSISDAPPPATVLAVTAGPTPVVIETASPVIARMLERAPDHESSHAAGSIEADTLRMPLAPLRHALETSSTVIVDLAQLETETNDEAVATPGPASVIAVAPEPVIAAAPEPEPVIAVAALAETVTMPAPIIASPEPQVVVAPVGADLPAFEDFEEAFFASEPAEVIAARKMAAAGDL